VNKIKEKDMKKVAKFGLCFLIAFGFTISTLPAAQEKDKQNVTQKGESSEIKQLTIRNSGFRSKSTVVIRYRANDNRIVEVIENGQNLPESEFSRYESIINDVLEIPQIDQLLPDIDRASRIAESQRISEESKIHEMLALRQSLEGLESDVARRYRDLNELQLRETLNRMTEKISESSDLSQEEKIAQLKEVIEKIQALELAKKEEGRRRSLMELETSIAARRLIEEIDKSDELSKEEKIKEIKELLQRIQVQAEDRARGEARRENLVKLEAANVLRKMLAETARRKDLSEREIKKEIESLLQEARSMKLEGMQRMADIEKFKLDLHQLLKKEGLLPEGKAEFVLKMNECSIDGKELPKEIQKRILRLCEENLGKKFGRDTKIILQLNEDR
jgi:hypothetical protein